jgi:hypothetical protein
MYAKFGIEISTNMEEIILKIIIMTLKGKRGTNLFFYGYIYKLCVLENKK